MSQFARALLTRSSHDALLAQASTGSSQLAKMHNDALEGSKMRLMIDITNVTFTVSRDPHAKMDGQGPGAKQKADRNTGFPLWTVQLVAMEADGAEVINVAIAGEQPPKVTLGQLVTPLELQAIPWAQNGKNGTAFRTTELKPVSAGKSAA